MNRNMTKLIEEYKNRAGGDDFTPYEIRQLEELAKQNGCTFLDAVWIGAMAGYMAGYHRGKKDAKTAHNKRKSSPVATGVISSIFSCK